VALITNNISGSASNSSLMGITGSVIFANRPDATFPGMPGSDVTFYVSGSTNANADVSVFGGDLIVSGGMTIEGNTLEITGSLLVTGSFDLDGNFVVTGDLLEVTGTLIVTEGLSGSLTKLSDGTSYLVEGSNITIVSQSNGSVVISSVGAASGDSFFSSTTAGSIYTTGSAAFSDQESVDSPADKGTDVFFYVSGSVGSKDGATAGSALFGGDVVVSGSMFAEGNRFEMTGTLEVTNGISGSLTQLVDGTSYLIAGSNVSITSQSNGAITISNTFVQADDYFDSTTAGSIFTTGSAAFKGQESIDSPSDKGVDVFFYVSGSTGLASNEKSLFGGDVVVSGSFSAFGDIVELTGTLVVTQGISGSLTQLTDGTSYLIAGSGVSITSASNGAVTISTNTTSYSQSFTSGDLSGGILTVTHNLSSQYVSVTVYDNNDKIIIPDDIIATSTNVSSVDLWSFAISGTWRVVVLSSGGGVGGGGTPGGSNTNIQYNNAGAFAGSNNFTFDGSSVFITGSLVVSGAYVLNVMSGTAVPTYAVGTAEHVVVFTSNVVTATLPSSAPIGRKIIFKDGTGNASVAGGQMLSCSVGIIDGSATFTLPSIDYTSISAIKINNPDEWILD
jgi:hypothetical protein